MVAAAASPYCFRLRLDVGADTAGRLLLGSIHYLRRGHFRVFSGGMNDDRRWTTLLPVAFRTSTMAAAMRTGD